MTLLDLLHALNETSRTVVVTRAEATPNPVGDQRVTRNLPRARTIPAGRYTISYSRYHAAPDDPRVRIIVRHENIPGAVFVWGLLAEGTPIMDVDLSMADLTWLTAALPGFVVCTDLDAILTMHDTSAEELLAAYIRLCPEKLADALASLTGGAA